MSHELRDPAVVDERTAIPTPVAPPARRSLVKRVLLVLVPVAICLGGVAVAGMLVATRPQAAHVAPETRGVPVRVSALEATTQRIRVRASGSVLAAQKVLLQPELSGRVQWMSPELVPGGRVRAGEPLVRIDPRDYRTQLEQQAAQLENSRLGIQQEESRRLIAEREWELLRREQGASSEAGRELALRQPQLRTAQAQLRAAESGVRQARTNLTRTTVVAPFDAFVQTESVDLGQLVGPASQLATLVGTDRFWVQVSVPMEQLAWIRVPGLHEGDGSSALVYQEVGERGRIERTGRVVRLLGDLDPVGRMARVLVEIDDPLGLAGQAREAGDASALPLLLGAFVNVEIDAGELSEVFEIPRAALHAGDVVHLFGEGSRLNLREVEVVWRRDETVLVRGLEEGALLVTSRVPTPIEGTLLRRIEAPPSDAGGSEATIEGESAE